jgi:hypothetical protein
MRAGTTSFISKYSISTIPNEVVVARAAKLGVSFGLSPSQVNALIELLKETDLNRTLIIFK